eukprot:scaffold1.g5831.t1
MTTVLSAEERAARKRQLSDDLVLVRTQKAEVLRQIQQIAKKQRTSAVAGPLSVEERRLLKREEQRRRMEAIWQTCLKIIQELLKNSNTKTYFGEPVKVEYVPNYYQIIKNPMDLGTIKSKLERRKYTDVYQFRDDVRLVFNNCRQYNPPGNFAANRFEQKWVQLAVEHTWESEIRRQELEEKQLAADTIPSKLAEVDQELQELTKKAETRAAPLPPPGPGREMTFEEKRKLSHSLGQLPGERLAHVLEIIAEGPSAPQLDNDEEYELDIDALDTQTLWKLQTYVDGVLAEIAAKQPATGPPPAAAANPGSGAGGAPLAQQQQQPPPAAQATASESEEVGSKGGAGSTLGDHPPAGGGGGAPMQRAGGDITTFVSATGPGAQPHILKNVAQKKDVQLQNAGAWANLTAAPPAGAPAAPAAAPPPAAAPGGGDAPPAGQQPGGEEQADDLWTEFQGREAAQKQAEEQKKAAEDEERRKREAEVLEMRRKAEEVEAALKRAEQEREEEARRKVEEQRAREARQFEDMAAAAADDEQKQPDIAMRAGHTSNADLAELGLHAREEEEEEEAMEEDI